MARKRDHQIKDTNFDLNLAPFLDIIVSIVPLLLLVVAFSSTKLIETPVPHVVQKAIENLQKKPGTEITLRVAKDNVFYFKISGNGTSKTVQVAQEKTPGAFENLYAKAAELKRQYPEVFSVSVEPDSAVELKEIVGTIDGIRKFRPGEPNIRFKDPTTGQELETDLMFPKVAFGNVLGD